jgi:hypothetical protein
MGNTTGGSQDVSLIEVSAADGQKRDLVTDKFFRITKMAWLATALVCCSQPERISARTTSSGDSPIRECS